MLLIKKITRLRKHIVLLTLLALAGALKVNGQVRMQLDISGKWAFSIDNKSKQEALVKGITPFNDSISLPGTMDLNGKGKVNKDTSTLHLNRKLTYEGAALYQKQVVIPASWKGKKILLCLERSKYSSLWVDGVSAGSSPILEAPKWYDLTNLLEPGNHTISLIVDNSLSLTPFGNVHATTDETQTNWNGVIGKIFLEARNSNSIESVKVTPNIDKGSADVEIRLPAIQAIKHPIIQLQGFLLEGGASKSLKSYTYSVNHDTIIKITYPIDSKVALWDEYEQPLYRLNVQLMDKKRTLDAVEVPFAMRKFATQGTNFTINGRITFLRGKHDACVFPLTGCPPMDKDSWIALFKTAKSYGINHYRFHTWCPPLAAFEAADEQGIYLQPELPFWGGMDADSTMHKLQKEGDAILAAYANHPSFVMFSMGNEIWSGHNRVDSLLKHFKSIDSRPLYVQGSNNSIGYMMPSKYADFHIAARTPYAHDTTLTHVRMSHGFVDSPNGGIINTNSPSNNFDYSYAVSQIGLPMISHEIGQYQIFPDYKEIDKYKGILEPRNLMVFRERLVKSGMMSQNLAFQKASGALSVICYKAEIEAQLRTKGLGGFQLLDLQDYPGQGTALVGILDAFMDNKGVVSSQEWREFCNDVVPMLQFEKFVWTNESNFTASIDIANYSNRPIKGDIEWSILDGAKVINEGVFDNTTINNNGVHKLGTMSIPLTRIDKPSQLIISLAVKGTGYKNHYSIWVFPRKEKENNNGISVCDNLEQTIKSLKKGETVLLMPTIEAVKENSLAGLFNPEFWNYGMFKGISEWAKKPYSPGTMGLLIAANHPIFKNFPTESHSNWQWWNIVKHSNSLIIDSISSDTPIVQVIDNLERNHKLGMIMEYRVGAGKLLICMSRLNEIMDNPEAQGLYNALLTYMKSSEFAPTTSLTEEQLKRIVK